MLRYGEGPWYFSILSAFLVSIAYIFPKSINFEQFWLAICILCGASIIQGWYIVGNHMFIQFYWSLSLFIACLSNIRMESLAVSARYILGGLFFFASTWKFMSDDFNSGATMQYLLTTTLPLGEFAVAFSDMTHKQLASNMDLVESLLSGQGQTHVTLSTPDSVRSLANFLTLGTHIIEGSLALIFLLPLSIRWAWLREAGLLFFILTTYALIPVAPFATQLACLGYALTRSRQFQAIFISAFLIYQIVDLRLYGLWGPA
jgi:hypothetical protein